MSYEKEHFQHQTPQEFLLNWPYPIGIAELVEKATPGNIELLRRGLLVLAPKSDRLVSATLRGLMPYTQDVICFPASKLLHLIRKDVWMKDFETGILDLVEKFDAVGVCQVDVMSDEDVRDLDKWLAVRALAEGRVTVLMGKGSTRFKSTIDAYEDRILKE